MESRESRDIKKLGNIPLVEDVYTKEEVNAELRKKQDMLTFDDVPAEDSGNPVKSGGVYAVEMGVIRAIGDAMDAIVADIGIPAEPDTGLFAQDESTGLWHKIVIEDDGEGRKVLAAEQTGIER